MPPATRRDAMVLLLAFAGASVDAVSFLGLGGVFTANMTGNTILLAVALAQGRPQAELRSIIAVIGFVVGVALGELIVVRSRERSPWPGAVTLTLAIELIPLIALAVGWHTIGTRPAAEVNYLLIALSALAMGIQTAAVRRLGIEGVTTTFISGTLTTLAAETVQWLHARELPRIAPKAPEARLAPTWRRGAMLTAVVWCVYALGAVVSGIAELRWRSGTLLLPIGAVLLVIAIEAIGRELGDGTPS